MAKERLVGLRWQGAGWNRASELVGSGGIDALPVRSCIGSCMMSRIGSAAASMREQARSCMQRVWVRMSVRLSDRSGQGTTEYAILVGVLVVIAILAITMFKPKIQELWDAIASGINGL